MYSVPGHFNSTPSKNYSEAKYNASIHLNHTGLALQPTVGSKYISSSAHNMPASTNGHFDLDQTCEHLQLRQQVKDCLGLID